MVITSTSPRPLVAMAVASVLAVASLTACSTSDPPDVLPSASATSTSAPTPTSTSDSPSSTPSSTSSSTPSSLSSSSSSRGGMGGGGESESARPLPTGKPLGLGDFFLPEDAYGARSGWEENRYDVAGRSQVQGIANTISGCSTSNAKILELRLKNSFSQLTFSVGQSDDSASSSQNVTVEVQANNTQVEIQRVPFNQVQDFTIPVNGVNALQILMSLDSEVQSCGGSVVAVMTDAKLS